MEYKGATITTCEVVWLQKLFSNLEQLVDIHIVIYCDNIISILPTNNLIYHARTKPIEVHYHFVRKKIIARKINLIHVGIKD
jgi:N-acetylmuramoyl-L-alanine amidase CwlA